MFHEYLCRYIITFLSHCLANPTDSFILGFAAAASDDVTAATVTGPRTAIILWKTQRSHGKRARGRESEKEREHAIIIIIASVHQGRETEKEVLELEYE